MTGDLKHHRHAYLMYWLITSVCFFTAAATILYGLQR